MVPWGTVARVPVGAVWEGQSKAEMEGGRGQSVQSLAGLREDSGLDQNGNRKTLLRRFSRVRPCATP